MRNEIDLLGLLWRSKVAVVLGALVGGLVGLGFFYLGPSTTTHTASASVVVRDTANNLDAGAARPERFVANQAQIIRSLTVATRASDMLASLESVTILSPLEIQEAMSVIDQENSDQIFITFRAFDEATALAGANAILEAFREVSSEGIERSSQAALERMDAQLASIETRLQEVAGEVAGLKQQDELLTRLQEQMNLALTRIADLQDELPFAGPERRADLVTEIAALRSAVTVFQEAQVGRGESAGVVALEEEQAQLINRRAVLLERQDSMAVDALLAPNTIEFSSPALFALPTSGLDVGRAVGAGIVLGVLATSLGLYYFATRRETVTDKADVELILGAPQLAEVPDFGQEGLSSNLPIRDAPRSASAEAFRFAATSLEKALALIPARSVLITSSTVGHGKSVVVANIVLAVARRGLKVLAIDADFGSQELTSLMTGHRAKMEVGITDVLGQDVPLERAVWSLRPPTGIEIGLLSRGSQVATAVDVLRQPKAHSMFRDAAETNDLVFVDSPPFLQVAYSATLASYVDAVVVVVKHGTPKRELLELSDRLRLVGAKVVGYVFNGVPLTDKMTMTGGSMRDVVGDRGFAKQSPPRRRSEG